jgi:hypothetical protein
MKKLCWHAHWDRRIWKLPAKSATEVIQNAQLTLAKSHKQPCVPKKMSIARFCMDCKLRRASHKRLHTKAANGSHSRDVDAISSASSDENLNGARNVKTGRSKIVVPWKQGPESDY